MIPTTRASRDNLVQPKTAHTGLERIVYAFGHSWRGMRYAWTTQAAFRQEVLVLVPLSFLAILLGGNLSAKCVVIGSHLTIVLIEVLNTAIECVVDRIGMEHHPLSGAAKDLGSAAVLLSFALSALAWLVFLAL